MQMSYSYASHLRFENVCKIAQDAETIRNVWEKSNDGYSLSIRVQTTINPAYFDFYFFMFLRQYQRQRKCFLSEREMKKTLCDTLMQAAWLGSSNFLLVRSELSWTLVSPGSAPIWGGKKGEFRDWTRIQLVNKKLLPPPLTRI